MLKRPQIPIILAAIAVATTAAAQPAPELPRPDDGYFQVPRKVAAGVWVLMEPRFQVQPIGNVSVIEQADGLILVDSGGSPGAGRRIVAMVRSLSRKRVKAVIITHWHGDHVQGLSEILKAWPRARTIAARQTQAHLADPHTMNTPAAPDPAANTAFQAQVKAFAAYARTMGDRSTDLREKAGWPRSACSASTRSTWTAPSPARSRRDSTAASPFRIAARRSRRSSWGAPTPTATQWSGCPANGC